jgi:flagellar motor switch protein FliM
MSSPASPAGTRSLIMERLLGDSGDAGQVIGAGRSMAERALPLLMKRLAEEIGAPVRVDLQGVEIMRVAEARSLAAVSVMVCTLFGGDPDGPVSTIERDFSPVEIEVATLVFQEFAEVLNGSGRRSLDLRLPVQRAMAGLEAKRHVLRDGPAVRIVFALSTATERGTVAITIPQRVILARNGADADAEDTSRWQTHFSEEVKRSTISLTATMPLAKMSLGQLAGLRAGDVIELGDMAQSHARLGVRDRTLFVCELGKLGKHYTVRISQPHDEAQDFMDGLAPG